MENQVKLMDAGMCADISCLARLQRQDEFAYRALPWWQKDSGLVAIAAVGGFSVVGVLALLAPSADPKAKRKRH